MNIFAARRVPSVRVVNTRGHALRIGGRSGGFLFFHIGHSEREREGALQLQVIEAGIGSDRSRIGDKTGVLVRLPPPLFTKTVYYICKTTSTSSYIHLI